MLRIPKQATWLATLVALLLAAACSASGDGSTGPPVPSTKPAATATGTPGPATMSPTGVGSEDASTTVGCDTRSANPIQVGEIRGAVAAAAVDHCSVAVLTDTGGRPQLELLVLTGSEPRQVPVALPLTSAEALAATRDRVVIGGSAAGKATIVTLDNPQAPKPRQRLRARSLPGTRLTAVVSGAGAIYAAVAGQTRVWKLTGRLAHAGAVDAGVAPTALGLDHDVVQVAGRSSNGQYVAGPAGHPRPVPDSAACGPVWLAPTGASLACNRQIDGTNSAAWLYDLKEGGWTRTVTREASELGPLTAAPRGDVTVAVLAGDEQRSLLIRAGTGKWRPRPLTGIDTLYSYQPSLADDGHTLWLVGTGPVYRTWLP